MSDGRLHALHWAFFVEILDMEFVDLHQMFSAWCQSVPADEMTRIMAMGDELFGDNDEDDNIDDFTDVYDFAEELDWKKRRAEFKQQS